MHFVNSAEVAETLLNAGTDLHAKNTVGDTPLHWTKSAEIAETLLNAGADPNVKNQDGKIPQQINRYVAEAIEKRPQQKENSLSCEYTSGYSKIKAIQCGQRNLCIAEVSCSFNVGVAPITIRVSRSYQTVCSALGNGECPEANDCALDRSVVEETEGENQGASSNSSSNKSSSQGVR